MSDIKSLLLNFLAIIFFAVAFLFLIGSVVTLFMPYEFQDLSNSITENVPGVIVDSPAFKDSFEQHLFANMSIDNPSDFNAFISALEIQCNSAKVPAELAAVCSDVSKQDINSKEELFSIIQNKVIKPQLKMKLQQSLDELKPKIVYGKKFALLLFLCFSSTIAIGTLFIFLDRKDVRKTISRMLSYILFFSAVTVIIMLVLLFVLPAVVESIVNNINNNLVNSLEGVDAVDISGITAALSGIIKEWLQSFIQKLVFSFLALTVIIGVLKISVSFFVLKG